MCPLHVVFLVRQKHNKNITKTEADASQQKQNKNVGQPAETKTETKKTENKNVPVETETETRLSGLESTPIFVFKASYARGSADPLRLFKIKIFANLLLY